MMNDRNAKIGVLDGLIKYMRQLELAKDEPKDALGDGMDHLEQSMDKKPEGLGIEIEADEPEAEKARELKDPMAEDSEDMGDGEEMSPLHKEMKDYFNNKDKPKVGSSMSFMVESKKPLALVKKGDHKMDAMDVAMKKRKSGRPRKG